MSLGYIGNTSAHISSMWCSSVAERWTWKLKVSGSNPGKSTSFSHSNTCNIWLSMYNVWHEIVTCEMWLWCAIVTCDCDDVRLWCVIVTCDCDVRLWLWLIINLKLWFLSSFSVLNETVPISPISIWYTTRMTGMTPVRSGGWIQYIRLLPPV